MNNFDLVSSLHALPETNPIEVDGIQFNPTCQSECVLATANVIQTVCLILATCN
jgi:hypothetical protein